MKTNQLPERLRKAITEIRRKPYPISDLIPLLSAAADALQARAQASQAASAEDMKVYASIADRYFREATQAEAQQPATAIACGIPGMAKTTCPYCEQGFAFEHEQPATGEPVLFIHPDTFAMDNAHVGAWKPGHELTGYIPLYTHPAPSVPADVVRDAERFRCLNLTEKAIAVVDSMLAAKEGTNGEIN